MTWSEGKVVTLTLKAVNDGKVTIRFNGKETTIKVKAGQVSRVL